MNLEERLEALSHILIKYSPFFSQWDEDVIQGQRFKHHWYDKLSSLSKDELIRFDALREFDLLKDDEWLSLVKEMEILTTFPKIIKSQTPPNEIIGKKKKAHELTGLYNLLHPLKIHSIVDFGGGVGNLAFFLNNQLEMQVDVLEQNKDLIDKGKQKFTKSDITFHHVCVGSESQLEIIRNKDACIGLHTCGSFANHMLNKSSRMNVNKIINFGCCYSKLQPGDYNLSSVSNKNVVLNDRALSCATLSPSQVPKEFYYFREQIINYKLTFYKWIFEQTQKVEFFSMSNSRRTLFTKSFSEFCFNSIDKYLPNLEKPSPQSLEEYYLTNESKSFQQYLSIYYALSRYFSLAIESYLICDRALLLKEQGYKVEIKEVFDKEVSPRNLAIIADKK